VIATVGLSIGGNLALAPVAVMGNALGLIGDDSGFSAFALGNHFFRLTGHSWVAAIFMFVIGVFVLTLLMHVARGVGRGHARLAKALLVEPGA
jgi:Putative sensor